MEKDYTLLINVDELCEVLMVSHNVAYQLVASGKIKCFRIGRVWKIPRASVDDYIREQSGIRFKSLA